VKKRGKEPNSKPVQKSVFQEKKRKKEKGGPGTVGRKKGARGQYIRKRLKGSSDEKNLGGFHNLLHLGRRTKRGGLIASTGLQHTNRNQSGRKKKGSQGRGSRGRPLTLSGGGLEHHEERGGQRFTNCINTKEEPVRCGTFWTGNKNYTSVGKQNSCRPSKKKKKMGGGFWED